MTRAAGPPPDGWTLWRRHAEGGAWDRVLATSRALHLHDEVRAPTFARERGDLVVTRAPGGARRSFWVVTASGALVETGAVPQGARRDRVVGPWDWEDCWARATGQDLARLCRGVDPRRLILAACEVVEPVLVLAAEPSLQFALSPADLRVAVRPTETARRWAEGGAAPVEELRAAVQAARALGQRVLEVAGIPNREWLLPVGATNASVSVAHAAMLAQGAVPETAANRSVADEVGSALAVAAEAASTAEQGDNPAEGLRRWAAALLARNAAQGDVVRRWVPLPELLLGRAGEPTPPDAVS